METKSFKDIKLSRLGMGNMRLPAKFPGTPNSPIDWDKAHEILDYALANGINYYDTAYVYNGGESEKCVGGWISKNERDAFNVATKWNIGANPDYKAVFEEQCARLQTDHIDFYLIHCIMDGNVDRYLESGGIEYFLDLQKQGRIKYLGFSSHASCATLEKFANHHKWDFAQLQINYYDWLYSETKTEYKILTDRDIPVVVMEPVRGGKLADLTPDANALLKAAHPDWSIASWALRFVRSLPNVQVILSGMSNMEQMIDNVNTFNDETPFTKEDEELLFKACRLFKAQLSIPCTACRYCTDGCPAQINIPEFIKIYNIAKVDGPGGLKRMAANIRTEGQPSDCIGCGACTGHCPQNIDVPSVMTELTEILK